MKCQSDFDNETEKTLRQADECVDPWWEGKDEAKPDQAPPAGDKADVSAAVAEEEAVRRGLLRVTEEGETCLSCQEEESPKK